MIAQEEFYVQYKNMGNAGVGIVGVRSLDAYVAYQYRLTSCEALLTEKREFHSTSPIKSYQKFQQFVKKTTGAPPRNFDPDSDFLGGDFSRSLEKALRNHIDMS